MESVDDHHLQALDETGFWGRAGAGGVVYSLSTGRLLVPKRSEYVLEPGTWGTWGGAVDPGEDLLAAALREFAEEAGLAQETVVEVIESFRFVDRDSGFFYQNFLVVVRDEFEPQLNWESEGFTWARPGELVSDLHPGLQALLQSDLARSQIGYLDARRVVSWLEPNPDFNGYP